MLFGFLLLVSSTLFSSLAATYPTTSEVKPHKKMVMQFHELDLDAYEKTGNTSLAFVERKQVKICGHSFQATFDRCLAMGAFGSSLAFGIAGLVYQKAQKPNVYARRIRRFEIRVRSSCQGHMPYNGAAEHHRRRYRPLYRYGGARKCVWCAVHEVDTWRELARVCGVWGS